MIKYDNRSQLKLLLRRKGSVMTKAMPVGLATGLVGFLLAVCRRFDMYTCQPNYLGVVTCELGESPDGVIPFGSAYIETEKSLGSAASVLGFLVVMRTSMGLSRWMRSMTFVETMLSKWSDAFNTLNTFFAGMNAKGDDKEQFALLRRVQEFRVKIAHWFCLMSCCAFATLREASHHIDLEELPVMPKHPKGQGKITFAGSRPVTSEAPTKSERLTRLELAVFHKPTQDEQKFLQNSSDKVNVIMLWIIQSLSEEINSKVVDAPPPIVSRVYQEISQGMMGYHQATMMATVPFPFPFAQMVSAFLAAVLILVPFYIDVFTRNIVFTPLLSFFIPFILTGLNVLAVQLELPFSLNSNCIDIEPLHEEFFHMVETTLLAAMVPPESEPSNILGNTREAKLCESIRAGIENRGKVDVDWVSANRQSLGLGYGTSSTSSHSG